MICPFISEYGLKSKEYIDKQKKWPKLQQSLLYKTRNIYAQNTIPTKYQASDVTDILH